MINCSHNITKVTRYNGTETGRCCLCGHVSWSIAAEYSPLSPKAVKTQPDASR